MRSLRNTNGQMRVIEVILASFIILGALSFVNFMAVSPKSPGYEITDLEKMGYSALIDLDQQGVLIPMVYDQRWSDLRTILRITLPNDVYFNLEIYTLSGLNLGSTLNSASDSQILYGDLATFSDAKNIASITYCLSGETDYDPRVLILQLSRG